MQEQDLGALDVGLLVQRAAEGDRWAWECLVDQYARLIWAVTRDFRLGESDAADVTQVTWLRLLEHIDHLEQPARVGAWLAATARNECLRSLAALKRVVPVDDDVVLRGVVAHEADIDERLLADERAQAVREALSRLPRPWQQLIELLMADPPASYAEISDQLGLPVGSIGPTRGRCLAKLRVLLQSPEQAQRGASAKAWKLPRLGQPAAGQESSVSASTHSTSQSRELRGSPVWLADVIQHRLSVSPVNPPDTAEAAAEYL